MFVLRSKLSIGRIIYSFLLLGILAVAIYLATLYPTCYIAVAFFALLFLIWVHKSEFVAIKSDGIIYRKYLIWKKIKYSNIKVLFITKHCYFSNMTVSAFHDKVTKQISGCIFLMKDISVSAKGSLKNSIKMRDEWRSILIDFQYKKNILETVLAGGFDGEIYITDEMDGILGAQIKEALSEAQFDLSKFKVLETNDKYSTLKALCEKYNAQLTRYEYYEKVFGDFVIEIEYKDKLHKVITEKGDIYLDSNLLSDNSYHVAGQADTFTRLLDLLETELFEKS